MTEEEKLKDNRQTRNTLIMVCIGFIIFIFYNISTHSKKTEPASYQSTESTSTGDTDEFETNSERPNIVSCPKCGRSYNKNTWGEMCNTCWSEGKSLKVK